MTALCKVTDNYGKEQWINPDHVRSVGEGARGAKIVFADRSDMGVQEPVMVVLAAIRGAS